jgi:hypothetical protein
VVGHKTITQKFLPLKDVLDEIKASAFVNSKYPVILHLLMHCAKSNCKNATDLILNTLGPENILMLDTNITENDIKALDSPENLKGKFIIMSKRKRFIPQTTDLDSDDLRFEDNIEYVSHYMKQSAYPSKTTRNYDAKTALAKKRSSDDLTFPSQIPKASLLVKRNVDPKFANYIFMICRRQAGIDNFQYPWEVAENSCKKILRKYEKSPDENAWRTYLLKNMIHSRQILNIKEPFNHLTYTNEGILDPAQLWNLGIQMVGIFRGIKTKYTIKNDLFFENAGGKYCGYAKKKEAKEVIMPASSTEVIEFTKPATIKFNLLSVNQIPQVKKYNSESKFKITFDLKGAEIDEKHYEFDFVSDGYRYLFPKPLDENVFMCEFKLVYPERDFVLFALYHEDQQICQYGFTAKSVRLGYRIIPFYSLENTRYAFSSLLGYFVSSFEDSAVKAF